MSFAQLLILVSSKTVFVLCPEDSKLRLMLVYSLTDLKVKVPIESSNAGLR
jgi:hypothetical protein